MTEDLLQVELVSADRLVWSGPAAMVVARTTEGDVGILPNHAPVLSLMVDGVLDVRTAEGEEWIAAVDSGFLSVAHNRVSVLAEHATMAQDIDLEKARQDLERAHQTGELDTEQTDRVDEAWARARVSAAERAGGSSI